MELASWTPNKTYFCTLTAKNKPVKPGFVSTHRPGFTGLNIGGLPGFSGTRVPGFHSLALPQKNQGVKNMQNFGRFYTTSDFDREYLRNCSRYLKSESEFFQIDSFWVLRKRSGELWSTSCWELVVRNEPLKCTFLANYISAIRGCCALKFFRALQIGQALLAHIRTGRGVHPKNFNPENLKFSLKFSVWARITSELVGASSQNFFPDDVPRVSGDEMCINFGRPAP